MKKGLRIQFNSPVVLGFAILSLVALVLGDLTGGWTSNNLFCVYRSSLRDPLTYVRLFFHVLGHASWEHYSANILLILVIGPQLEDRYGSEDLLITILLTAFITGVIQCLFFSGVGIMGASGIVFMMILMASMGGMKGGCIPLTLIFVAVFYIGNELVTALTVADDVSQLSHVVGGICGALFGFVLEKR